MNEPRHISSTLRLRIGVMGGAGSDIAGEYLGKAWSLGEAIARSDCMLVTGACPGLPLHAARGAKEEGGFVIGISPALSLDEHAYRYESPTLAHDVLIFTGSGLMGREVVNIRSSDIVVIVGGSSGTLGELAIAYDEGKLIGVLTGTGGISDMVESIIDACQKETGARVIYEDGPDELIRRLLAIYQAEHFRHPSVFCHETECPSESPVPGAHRDIVCGMWITPRRAAARRTRGATQYPFCSLECAARFDMEPTTYLAGAD